MPVSDSKQETKVMLVPSVSLHDSSADDMKVVSLRHPGTGTTARFVHCPRSGSLAELLAFGEEHRAWFLGHRILQDGKLLLATPVNPVFLVLPYLAKAERLVPLDQMLEDADFPLTDSILSEVKGLEVIAERKGDKDLNVWKFNSELALEWLEGRVIKVGGVLQQQGIDLTGGAQSHTYRNSGAQPTKEEYSRYALGIVSEYLPTY